MGYASGTSAHYEYDGANRHHDTADRLHQITYPDKTEQYTFDNAWNRLTEVVTDTASGTVLSNKTLSYNDRHQLTNIDDSIDAAHSATFNYDANGNQIEKVKDAVVSTFVYDARNHLRSVTTGGSTVGQFLYDYRGLRTEKQGERGTERYSYDDQSVLFQSDHNNTPTAQYEYGPHRLLSLKQPNLGSEFYLFDALRSPVTLIKGDGTITARYAYDAWGEKRHESGNSFNRFGFTGHEHDEETGLIYAKARYYDPDTARFTSEDPFAGTPDMPPSLHKYLYAYQNPTVYVDPDGRFSVDEKTTERAVEKALAKQAGRQAGRSALRFVPYVGVAAGIGMAIEDINGILDIREQRQLAESQMKLSQWKTEVYTQAYNCRCTTADLALVKEMDRLTPSPVMDPDSHYGRKLFAENNPEVADARAGASPPVPKKKDRGAEVVVESGDRVANVPNKVDDVIETTSGTAIQTYYPPKSGFMNSPVNQTLEPGYRVSRFGGFYDEAGQFNDFGNFIAPENVPYPMRALPKGTDASKPYSVYEVLKPIPDVPSGPAAPWFGEIGTGMQHELPLTIQDYLDGGYLKLIERVDPK